MSARRAIGWQRLILCCWAAAGFLAGRGRAQDLIGEFPVVQVPPGNPLTPGKALLGQALFYEEQLSSDGTVACATCHITETGGGDPRAGARHPGADGALHTPDDEFGSPGVVLQGNDGSYTNHAVFGIAPQVTARNSPTVIGAAFFNTQFWDARALPVFKDLSGQIVLPESASLETQAVEPIVSEVEMGHGQQDWPEETARLAAVRPLALASALPPSLDAFIGDSAGYGPLFERAFGTSEITRERIAMALASYERTLVPDRTPYHRRAMTRRQQQGFQVFLHRGTCNVCHTSENDFFTDGASRTIDLPDHQRFVKTPTLLNVALRRRFMSGGLFASLGEVLGHYERIGFLDPLMPDERAALLDFLENALTDPRVANREPPFDRPTLRSESQPHGSNLFGPATAGSGGHLPEMLADSPSNLGSAIFRIGLGRGLGGAPAVLAIAGRRLSYTAQSLLPVHVDIASARLHLLTLSGALPGEGVATFRTTLPRDPGLVGLRRFAQWFVFDPASPGGMAVSPAAEFELFSR